MILSEIAEFVIDNYPDSCIAHNHKVIKGCRDGWYEESLIDPLLSFYMYEKMDLCGCGIPEQTYEIIRLYLHIRKDWFTKDMLYEEVLERYKNDLHIDTQDSLQAGLLQFLAYVLDSHDFTEHGGSIGGCWLTEDGERLLKVLDEWHKRESQET
jgi:hypothetical protein